MAAVLIAGRISGTGSRTVPIMICPSICARRFGISLGYYIVRLAELHMSASELMSLFEEMGAAADALPRGVAFEGDCKLEFRQRQKHRFPHLETEQWTDLFALWTARYQGRECAKHAATQARFAELVEERRNLFIACAFMPPSAATAANARLPAIGRELADICAPRRPLPSLGTWG